MILGFLLSRIQDPLRKAAILAIFFTFLAGFLGPVGITLHVALIFAAGFYYGWVIGRNGSRIESLRRRVLFYMVASILALAAAFAYTLLLRV